jgi:NAD-dependent deacetylase
MMTLPYYLKNPDVVWAHTNALKRIMGTKRPTAAHRAIAQLARESGQDVVITQNVDGLEQRSGIESIIQLHGSISAYLCQKEGRGVETRDPRFNDEDFPICPNDGALLKPGVVFFMEGIDGSVFDRALETIEGSDLAIEVGTSHSVYPAKDLWRYALKKGVTVLCINADLDPETKADASFFVEGDCQRILPAFV